MKNMISYWKDVEQVCIDDEGQIIIIGMYDHYNEGNPRKAVGIHWGDYPTSRGVLAPCVLSNTNALALLSGVLHKAILNSKNSDIDKILSAINYLKD